MSSEEDSREGPHSLEDRGECDECGQVRELVVTASGKFCWECLPPEDLDRLLDDLL